MRVVSGSARGTKLVCPEGLSVRPTHDRVKEALFSMLSAKPVGARVLDLFAGSGALGIEALSRGAESAVFTDISPLSLSAITENVTKTHLLDKASIIKSDYLSYLKTTDETFDLIFMDPPYAEDFLIPALEVIASRKLLAPDGIIYCETGFDWEGSFPSAFSVIRDKKYGKARALLLKELSS